MRDLLRDDEEPYQLAGFSVLIMGYMKCIFGVRIPPALFQVISLFGGTCEHAAVHLRLWGINTVLYPVTSMQMAPYALTLPAFSSITMDGDEYPIYENRNQLAHEPASFNYHSTNIKVPMKRLRMYLMHELLGVWLL